MANVNETVDSTKNDAAIDPIAAALTHRRLVAWTTIALVAVLTLPGAVKIAMGRRTYTSQVLLAASGKRSTSNLSGLAAQFGVAVPGSDATQSPAFFVDLLKSRELLLRATDARVTPSASKQATTLLAHYQLGAPSAASRDRARRTLEEAVTVAASQKSGIITLEVSDGDPAVAQQLTAHLVELVGDVNLRSRQSQAAAERRFVEQRVKDADRALRAAENEERAFLIRNRNCCSAPDLQLQRDRLRREIEMRQQVYTQLMQAYETARLDEVRDTPTLSAVEGPTLPIRPDPTGLIKRGLLGILLGLGAGVFAAFGRELARAWAAEDPARSARLSAQLRELRHDLLRPWRLLWKARDAR